MSNALWHVASVRYATPELLRKHFEKEIWRVKCGTAGKLNLFADAGLLRKSEDGVYTANRETIEFLRSEYKIRREEARAKQEEEACRDEFIGRNPGLLRLAGGEGRKDTLYNSDILLSALKRPDFLALFYPTFNDAQGRAFLEPDGALLLRKDNRAKLILLEIERKKPDWEEHLLGKKWKYEKIASDRQTWEKWWKNKCSLLTIRHCREEEFGFSVWCVGDFQAQWPGWKFSRGIMDEPA